MKKWILKLLLPTMLLSLAGCAFFEFEENKEKVVDLGEGDTFVKWSIVENLNEYHPVQSAYFEVNKNAIKYYEDGVLIKEGEPHAVYFGEESTTSPLVIQLKFGKDENNISKTDYLYCFTEDEKDDVHQFSIMAEGYYIKPLRNGGVPVRDYHLSEMPYAVGTYVKEGNQQYTFHNSSNKTFAADKLKGSFVDITNNNKFYFLNNSFYTKDGYYFLSSNRYFRYENNINHTFIEGTIDIGHNDYSYEFERPLDYATLYVMHGQSEPAKEKGVYANPDYELIDFVFLENGTLSFSEGRYFYDVRECDWDPNNFVPGTYFPSQN